MTEQQKLIRATMWYRLSPEGQKAALAAGLPAAEAQAVEGDISPLDLDLFVVTPGGEAIGLSDTFFISDEAFGVPRLSRPEALQQIFLKLNAPPTSIGEVIAALRAALARAEARRAEREEQARQKRSAALADAAANPLLVPPAIDYLPDEPASQEYLALREERLDAAKARRAESERRAEEAKAAYDAERAAWIGEHGSPRLRRMQVEGVRHDRTYKLERLAAERPGWAYLADICGEEKGIHDPEQATLDALDEARKVAPDARLAWLADGQHVMIRKDQYGDPSCECGASVDGEGFEAGPIAVAELLGRIIVNRLYVYVAVRPIEEEWTR